MELYEILRRPLITEKNTLLGEQNKYMFEVAIAATKPEIQEAVETIFKVDVTAVNTSKVHGKTKRVGRSIGHPQLEEGSRYAQARTTYRGVRRGVIASSRSQGTLG